VTTETTQDDVEVVAVPSLTDGASLRARSERAYTHGVQLSTASDETILRELLAYTHNRQAAICAAVLDGVRDGLAAQK
jgi:hypothetical protein